MLTDNDFKRLTEFFASKFDLKEAIQGLEERFDKKFQEVLTRLDADSLKKHIKTIPPTSV